MGRFIPEETLDEIRNKADIIDVVGNYLPLQKRGADYWGCCPFHHEKTPSFKVNSDRQVFYCFGCKKSGNIFHFVEEMENTDFSGACEWLASRYNIEIPEVYHGDASAAAKKRKFKEDGLQLLTAAASLYQKLLREHPQAEAARQYLASRGMDQAAVEKFGLGYSLEAWDEFYKWGIAQGASQNLMVATGMLTQSPEDANKVYDRFRGRLMFPIKDTMGQVVGFSARVLTPEAKSAKYVNSPESEFFHKGEILYGMNFARAALKEKPALVCEGQMDVIACHRAGIPQAVAAQGTAFTPMHAQLLKKSTKQVRLAFDGDTAGMKATLRTIEILQQADLTVSIVTIPDKEDPDSIFRAGGAAALQQIMSAAEDAVPYIYRWSCGQYDRESPEGKSRIVEQVMRVVGTIQDEVARTAHAQWLAGQLNLPEHILMHRLEAFIAQLEKQKEAGYYSRNHFQNSQAQNQFHSSRRNQAGGSRPLQNAPRPSGDVQEASPEDGPESPDGGLLPAFHFDIPELQNPLAPAVCGLLDLMIHYQDIACQLVKEDIISLLPDLPVAGALNAALAAVEAGEWEMLQDELAEGEFVTVPEVGQVLNDSQFLHLDPEAVEDQAEKDQRKELLQRAVRDCLAKLKLAQLDREYDQIKEKVAAADDAEKKKLMLEMFRIVRDKKKLKAGAPI